MNRDNFVKNLTVILEGILHFVLLRLILVGIVSQIIKIRLPVFVGLMVLVLYYLSIILIGFFIGLHIAKKSPTPNLANPLIAVISYTGIAVAVTALLKVDIYELALSNIINILACALGAIYALRLRQLRRNP